MPSKICPDCGKKHGSRKKKCDCGHSFSVKSHPLYPEPGGWVLDTYSGMPKIEPPYPLEKGCILTLEEVQEQISYEGLGFCVYNFIQPEMIEDLKLRGLWIKASKALRDIIGYIDGFEL